MISDEATEIQKGMGSNREVKYRNKSKPKGKYVSKCKVCKNNKHNVL